MDQPGHQARVHHSSSARLLNSLIILTSFVASSAIAAPTLVDRIVADVNGHAILHSELREKIDVGPIILVSDYPAKPKSSEYEQALNDAINIELIKSYAEELELEVSDAQVNEHIGAMLKERQISEADLAKMLAQQGKSLDDYKEDVRTQFLIRRFQGRVILPQIKITEKDVETYYLKKLGSSNQVVELQLRQIVLNLDEGASEAVKKAKGDLIKEIHQKLKGGFDFVEAVKLYSDEEDARERGGLMPDSIKLANLSSTIQESLKNVQSGEFSEPVQTPQGYHIFYVVDRSVSGGKEFQTRKAELEQELRMNEMVASMNKWLEQRHQRSKIEILSD